MKLLNLFTYATSELSQDAFICWLLSWALPEYKNIDNGLHQCAIIFIQALFEKHSKEVPSKFEKIEIFQQDHNIDVLCIINEKYALLIEDKTGTKNHSNQLERYLEVVKKKSYKEEDILPIYFKTEDQGDYSDVLDKGYRLFLRADFLEVLNAYAGNNSILLDYRNHLQSIADKVESYKLLPINKWDGYSWRGFYLRLQKELGSGNWEYVSPPKRDGFLGFYWHFHGDDICRQYLQLEEDKFCFKIEVNNPSDWKNLRSKWHKTIKDMGHEYRLKLKKPDKFGTGKHMTVCVYDGEYRECDNNKVIDIDNTIHKLRKAEVLLKEAVKENA